MFAQRDIRSACILSPTYRQTVDASPINRRLPTRTGSCPPTYNAISRFRGQYTAYSNDIFKFDVSGPYFA